MPLFHDLDDLILDNICDRVQPLLYSKDEKVWETDPHSIIASLSAVVLG